MAFGLVEGILQSPSIEQAMQPILSLDSTVSRVIAKRSDIFHIKSDSYYFELKDVFPINIIISPSLLSHLK